MKPGCCFMYVASDAHASCIRSASSGSTVKVLISTTEPTCCSSICSKSDTYLSISTNCGIYPPLLGGWDRHYERMMPVGELRRICGRSIHRSAYSSTLAICKQKG